MYQLIFFVPTTHVEAVKEALFAKGAGLYNHYQRCSWQVLGQGQFEPIPGSSPFIGTSNQLSLVDEYRVEMICPDEVLRDVIHELLQVHPYEVPAYYAVKIEI